MRTMRAHEINRQLESIINTMNDGLIVIAPDGAIVMINQAFESLTGYQAEEVIGQPCTLLSCDACELAIKHGQGQVWWCALFDPAHGGMKRCRCNYRKKDGSYVPVLKNASVLHDENGIPLGAVETLTDISELDRLDQEVAQLSAQLGTVDGFRGIVGSSPAMQKVFQVIQKAAASDAPVIIYGESGTGKELVARAIHQTGNRREMPYVQLSCAALNESLLESELFGHTKGAFTGAYRHRIGRFEAANGGDIFLDEIGDIPLSTQVKLLRVLETKQFERVGDHQPISVDVRVITATNRNLQQLLSSGAFREDLYFRINVIPIHLPPLRERISDVPALVNTFIQRFSAKTGKEITGLSREAMDSFMAYRWPGNVRELKGALEYAFVVAESGLIEPDHLPPQVLEARPAPIMPAGPQALPQASPAGLSEKDALVAALKQTGGNQTQAAALLGVNRVTVYNRMKKYGLEMKKVLQA
ncbi:MAG: sigma 54-interacting transcriptional regulator [Desulfarculaceae bacterium]|nr:sigma 54-interacting transcriptional regulator [Desulfarculaceae bacterium]